MDERFHAAQAILEAGDVEGLRDLLGQDPGLATERSECSHPTILQCLVLTVPAVDSLESLIDLLADHGADLTDPLIAASGMDNRRAIVALLDRGARIEGNGRWSPLEEALYWGHEDAVALLLERGAPINNLRTAAGLGERERIAPCFDASGALTPAAGEVASPFESLSIAEVIRRDPQQVLGNALVYAAAWGRTDAATDLLDRGAPVNLIPAGFDYAGTPLHYAAIRGRREMVDLLLGRGADPGVRDAKVGKWPEDWAAYDGHADLAEYLRERRQARG